MPRGQSHNYTDEQRQFISERRSLPRAELLKLFNKEFGASLKKKALESYCKRHGFYTGRNGCFEAGHKPWNTGTKGECRPNSGSFIPGQSAHNHKPIGYERICAKYGYVLVKSDEINPYTGRRGHYKAKHKLIWEKEHGQIPAGHVIRFVDGNKTNFDLDNLVCIPKSVNAKLNKSKVNQLPKELRGTAIAIARLEVAILNLSEVREG